MFLYCHRPYLHPPLPTRVCSLPTNVNCQGRIRVTSSSTVVWMSAWAVIPESLNPRPLHPTNTHQRMQEPRLWASSPPRRSLRTCKNSTEIPTCFGLVTIITWVSAIVSDNCVNSLGIQVHSRGVSEYVKAPMCYTQATMLDGVNLMVPDNWWVCCYPGSLS